MPYPFTAAPTWSELIEKLKDSGVPYFALQMRVSDIEWITAQYFENKKDGKVFRCEVKFDDKQERVMPNMVRYICNRLQINPSLFGLHLG